MALTGFATVSLPAQVGIQAASSGNKYPAGLYRYNVVFLHA